jgi:hypothetical protein
LFWSFVAFECVFSGATALTFIILHYRLCHYFHLLAFPDEIASASPLFRLCASPTTMFAMSVDRCGLAHQP